VGGMSDWQSFDLPVPVSTNKLYDRTRAGAVRKSKRYCTWLNAAGWIIRTNKPKQVRVACEVVILIERQSQLDADNCAKCVLDGLQAYNVVLNDSLIDKLTIERADIEGCRVSIRPLPMSEAA